MEAGAGELVRHLLAGHQPDIVAGDDLLRRAHADGERAAGQQVLHRSVRRADAERKLLIVADAAPGGVHGAGRAILAIGSQNEHRLRINACMCAKILSHKQNTPSIELWQHRIIQREHSARDFLSRLGLKSAGILCVFQTFRTDGSAKNSRRRPKLQLCGVAL